MSSSEKRRLFYLDNLRVYLIILVIFHHASIAYGGGGSWPIKDPAVDSITPILLDIFTAVNQSYFMSAFFLLAGYFTPRSLEGKGSKQFLKDRVIRLVIPLVVYTTVIVSFNEYIIRRFMYGESMQIWAIMGRRITQLEYEPGHLWFLQSLLVFAIIYVVYRVLAGKGSRKPLVLYRDRFPPDKVLFLCIGVLAVLSFAVRLVFPVGVWFLHVQPGHFVHYTFCFYCGVLAYRGDWFSRLSRLQARRWGIMSLGVFPLLIVMGAVHLMLGGSLEEEVFNGGVRWQAFGYAIWESFLMIGIIVFLLYFFRERLNKAGPIARSMAANVYTVYIIHQTTLFALHIGMLSVNVPTILKFFIVSLIAVPLCFILSSLIRKIPYARRVLG